MPAAVARFVHLKSDISFLAVFLHVAVRAGRQGRGRQGRHRQSRWSQPGKPRNRALEYPSSPSVIALTTGSVQLGFDCETRARKPQTLLGPRGIVSFRQSRANVEEGRSDVSLAIYRPVSAQCCGSRRNWRPDLAGLFFCRERNGNVRAGIKMPCPTIYALLTRAGPLPTSPLPLCPLKLR
jgi:hypothetical protein